MSLRRKIAYLTMVLLLVPASAWADTVTLVSSRDTTIYQANPTHSNGAGQAMFAGNTGRDAPTRALIGFDIASSVPAGSTITSVQLSLVLARVAPTEFMARKIELHALLADWGEGTAGQGTGDLRSGLGFATPPDGTSATWSHRFFNTVPWTSAGGDFVATASASTMVGTSPNGTVTWGSTPAMVNDVQSWLNNPSANFGWLLLGDESATGTARVFFTREAPNSSVRPALVVTYTPPAAAVARLLISAPSSVTAGSPFDVTVTALDNNGNVATGYTGTVSFASSDPSPAVLPANYTFTSGDQGTHTFTAGVTLFTAGAQTLTVQDTANSSISGSATITVNPGATTQLLVSAPSSVVAGSPFDVTVTVTDSDGNVATGYTGTVSFASSDPFPAVLPANYTFTSGDQGTHTFTAGATLFTAGAQTLTVQDTANSSISGSATVAVVAAPASQFVIGAPASVVSGTPFDVALAAVDPYGNVDTNYAGTIAWTSSDTDPAVILPANYTFQTTDKGMVAFPAGVTLITQGSQTITATDTMSGISGSATVTVGSGP